MKKREFNNIDELLQAIKETIENHEAGDTHKGVIPDEQRAELQAALNTIKGILDTVEVQHGHQCAAVRALFASLALSAIGIINGGEDGYMIREVQMEMLGDTMHSLLEAKAVTRYEYQKAAESQDSVYFFNQLTMWLKRQADGITVEESSTTTESKAQAHYSEVTKRNHATLDTIVPLTDKAGTIH